MLFSFLLVFVSIKDFGKQYNLCLQPIYEARAKRLIMDLDVMSDNVIEILSKKNKKYCRIIELN